MEKKYQIIYIWAFLIISGIILLLLYTPLGGNLHYAAYSEQGRYHVSPGVNFSSQVGGFSGSSSSGGSYNYSSSPSAYTSPTYTLGAARGNYSAASGYSSTPSYGGGGGGGISLSSNAVAGGGSSSGGSGGGMLAVGGGGGSRSSNETSSSYMGGGNVGGGFFNPTTSVDGGVMQKGTTGENDPAGDPGGDPNGNPLPLKNDFLILMFFGLSFGFYKWLRFT